MLGMYLGKYHSLEGKEEKNSNFLFVAEVLSHYHWYDNDNTFRHPVFIISRNIRRSQREDDDDCFASAESIADNYLPIQIQG